MATLSDPFAAPPPQRDIMASHENKNEADAYQLLIEFWMSGMVGCALRSGRTGVDSAVSAGFPLEPEDISSSRLQAPLFGIPLKLYASSKLNPSQSHSSNSAPGANEGFQYV